MRVVSWFMTWGFLTNHARALLCIAHDPGVRLREIASTLDITERAAFGVVTDLVDAGYVLKDRHGRRNRYRVQVDQPLPEALLRRRTVGQLLALLADTEDATGDHPS
jgi:DNA-binding IclR family transcriptional regulator